MAQPLSRSHRKLIRALARKKGRREHRLYLAEGVRLLGELARDPDPVLFFYGLPDMLEQMPPELADCEMLLLEEDDAKLFTTEHSQGIGAVLRMPDPADLTSLYEVPSPLLFLDGVADPGNAGTIMRAADWFDIRALLFARGSVEPWNPKVVRASMGGSFRLTMVEDVSPEDLLPLGRRIYLLDVKGNHSLMNTRLDPQGIYVIGSEAHGLSPEWEGLGIGHRLLIPRQGMGESLNAAMATTILCWELSRLNQSAG